MRRITLASGRTASIVRPAPSPRRETQHDLHVCRRCACQLVQWSEWEQAGPDLWRISLHCPNCGWWRRDTFSGDQLEPLEDHLDSGFSGLLQDLRCLTQANMAEEVERFRHALQSDLILPEDF